MASFVHRRGHHVVVPPDPQEVRDVLVMLGEAGCALCRAREGATDVWLRWFAMENHTEVPTLTLFKDALGCCPAHTRRLLRLRAPAVLAGPWEWVLRGAVARAQTLHSTTRTGPRPAPVCPVCAVVEEHERASAEKLAGSLAHPDVARAVHDRGSLCCRHLRRLLPLLDRADALTAARAVHDLLDSAAGASSALVVVAGRDPDASARAALLRAHADHLGEVPAARGPADRLVADLLAGSCPVCRAVGREEARYLVWLGTPQAGRGPSGGELELCDRHTHDLPTLAPGGRWVVETAVSAARDRLSALISATQPPPPAPKTHPGVRALPTYEEALAAATEEPYCRTCVVGRTAAERQLALITACADDNWVLGLLPESHGLCLRHTAELPASPATGPVVRHTLSRLREIQWEHAEYARKQAFGARHEPKGTEETTWLRVPLLIDGTVTLGLGDTEAEPVRPDRDG
jgi:hypothetical protein